MKLRKSSIAAVLGVAAALVIAACGSDSGSETSDTANGGGASTEGTTGAEQGSGDESSAGADGSGKSLDISLLTTYNGLPFYTAMLCGAEDAAAKDGGDIKVDFDGPRRGMNAADQIPVLEAVMNRHPDGIIFVPADPDALNSTVQQAVDDGIAVVTTDGLLSQEIALAQFHGDNKAGGKMAADEMATMTKGESGKVLVLDNRPGLPITNDRANGFIEALKADENLSVLPVEYFEDDPNKASTIVQSKIASNPDIVGVFATAEAGTTGAVNALQAMDADVTVIAYDAGPVLQRALRDGTVQALVAQGSYEQGFQAMDRIVKYLRGEDISDLPFDNVIDNVLVTAENMDDPDVSKFLYPESCS